MDKYERFLRNLAKGEGGSARKRRRLMERELQKLRQYDGTGSNGLDGEIPRRDEGGDLSPRDDKS